MKLIKLNLEGTGFHILLEIEPGRWLCLNGRTPVNNALAERYIARWKDRISEIICHTNFFGCLPTECEGTII